MNYLRIFSALILGIIFSCAELKNPNFKHTFTNEGYEIYIDDSLDFWQSYLGLTTLFNYQKNKQKYFSYSEEDFLYQAYNGYLKKQDDNYNRIVCDVYALKDTLLYFKKIKTDKNVKNISIANVKTATYDDTIALKLISYSYNKTTIWETISKLQNGKFIRKVWIDLSQKNGLMKHFAINDFSRFIDQPNYKTLQKIKDKEYWELFYLYDGFIKNNYYKEDKFFNYYHPDSISIKYLKSIPITQLLDLYNFNGNYKKLEQTYYQKYLKIKPKTQDKDTINYSDYQVESIENFCNHKADSIDIVLLNENHFLENSRFTAMMFIDNLYKKGFRYFAAEAFSNKAGKLQFDLEIDSLDGYYVEQPIPMLYSTIMHYKKA